MDTYLTHHARLKHCKKHDRQYGEAECPDCVRERNAIVCPCNSCGLSNIGTGTNICKATCKAYTKWEKETEFLKKHLIGD